MERLAAVELEGSGVWWKGHPQGVRVNALRVSGFGGARSQDGPTIRTRGLAIQDPSTKAFDEFFSDEYRALLGAMIVAVGTKQDAEDIVQEAFVRVFERWDRISSMENPRGYLYRVAYNLCPRLSRAFDAKQHVAMPPLGDVGDIDAYVDMMSALQRLRPRDRTLLVLHAWLGLDASDLAKTLGLRKETVRVRLHRARRRIVQLMGGFDDEAE